ncbi:protoporphyrinogen oxidase [Marinobacter sp. HL-58]|uniref:protoporphyrinogen oxidase n=1 Tax=Marinobacter sp. HL-58 TaxID=1479237 RepID=UPI0006DA6DAF|nr:protoporphyrinogen oxidase [Marinobacter sp. HL-58]KPQ01578.1 MAG: oxygen-dependent protoporphyrinogen oxidase [Marinobacter sp. HL-58]
MRETTRTKECSFLIVGGGITGLSLALEVGRHNKNVTLVEADEQLGGNVRSVTEQGWHMELGPNTLMAKPALYQLLKSLNLADKAISPPSASRKRYVVKNGKPIALPGSLGSALKSPLIGIEGWKHILTEPFRKPATHEETLADFVQRRLGNNILSHFVDPFVSGVYAGDPGRLSAKAAFPRLYRLEQAHGSLLLGGLTQVREGKKQRNEERHNGFPDDWRGKLVSFPEGLSTLTDGIRDELESLPNVRIVTGSKVETIDRNDHGWRAVDHKGQVFTAQDLILTTPAGVSGSLMAGTDTRLKFELESISYPPLAAVVLGYPKQAVKHPLDGFGMLIPSQEKRQTLGALFSSTLFPERAPDGNVLFTCFIGGRRNTAVNEQSDQQLLSTVSTELSELLGISASPVFTKVARWVHAIPQYEIGHLDRVSKIDELVHSYSGLHLMGNWRDGISVGDCIDNGHAMARKLLGRCQEHQDCKGRSC